MQEEFFMKMEECRAIVTGGASGLGEATVRNIVQKGGKTVIFDLSEESGQRLQKELGESVLFLKADVTKEVNIQESVRKASEFMGGINSLINCAGIAIAEKVIGRKGVHDLALFSRVINVNLIGSFNVLRIVAENMISNEPNDQDERGVIINTASVAAFEGQIGQAAYSASKGGIVGMTLPIARELARYGIRVMAIAPGLFHTPMFNTLPQEAKESLGKMVPFPSRLGYPSEYAQLVQSIIENPMLNGETIRLDGAIRMQPK